MSDSVQTVTSQNWFQRITSSFAGIIFGIILFIAGLVLLWWNEGRSVAVQKSLQEGRAAVVSVEADQVLPDHENKLVRLSGDLDFQDAPVDSQIGVTADAVRLQRNVEMFQWVESSKSETKQKLGGGEETVTTYSYAKQWTSSLENSANFQQPSGHENPSEFPFDSQTFDANGIGVGAFDFSQTLIDQANWFAPYTIPNDTTLAVNGARLANGRVYIGQNPQAAQIGDVRIEYSIVPVGEVTVVARQAGDSLEEYPTRARQPIAMIREGNLTADQMFDLAQADNSSFTWILRLVGFVIIWVGLNLVGSPLAVIASVVPFFGRLVGVMTGFASFLIAGALSFFVIALAWLAYRPVLGVTLLLITGALVGWGISRAMKKKPLPAK